VGDVWTIEQWEAAYIDYFEAEPRAVVLGRLLGNILRARGETPATGTYLGAEHPAIVALNNLRERDVLVSGTSLISGHVEITTKKWADDYFPPLRE